MCFFSPQPRKLREKRKGGLLRLMADAVAIIVDAICLFIVFVLL